TRHHHLARQARSVRRMSRFRFGCWFVLFLDCLHGRKKCAKGYGCSFDCSFGCYASEVARLSRLVEQRRGIAEKGYCKVNSVVLAQAIPVVRCAAGSRSRLDKLANDGLDLHRAGFTPCRKSDLSCSRQSALARTISSSAGAVEGDQHAPSWSCTR